MTKMNRCPYGITKPICDRCERPCFGAKQTQEFLKIMDSTSKRMFLRHPMMSVKHKLASMGVDYAKYQQQKKLDDKVKAKEKAAKERAKERKGKK
jgi:citrate lyase gamma subunit